MTWSAIGKRGREMNGTPPTADDSRPAPSAGPGRGIEVEARGLSRRFGPHLALDAVALRIEPGESFGLLGANGAGKTTFIRLVTGFLLPTAGSVRVDGISPRAARARCTRGPAS